MLNRMHVAPTPIKKWGVLLLILSICFTLLPSYTVEAAGLNLQGLTDPNTAIMLHVEGTDNHSNDAPTNSDWQSW